LGKSNRFKEKTVYGCRSLTEIHIDNQLDLIVSKPQKEENGFSEEPKSALSDDSSLPF